MTNKKQAKTADCYSGAAASGALGVSEALDRLLASTRSIEDYEQLAIRTSLGRVLADSVISPIDVPGHTNSAMDGYAIRSTDVGGGEDFKLIGTALAGAPFVGKVGSRETVRIMTGAMMPAGADTVVMQEQAKLVEETVSFNAQINTGQNVRLAGEDLKSGQAVFERGTKIQAAELGMMASFGMAEVKVVRRPRVAFFSTGDELRSVGEHLQPGDIYDSNRYTIFGMLKRLDVEVLDMGVIPDQPDKMEAAFIQASGQADMVITSGGVSVGEADYVKQTLDKVGDVDFWKILMKPGKPLAHGRIGDALFFGLPGNPVAVMVTFYQFVQPTLKRLMGMHRVKPPMIRVAAAVPLRKSKGRTEFQRGILNYDESGNPQVQSTGSQGSGILSSMSKANCFIVLSPDQSTIDVGQLVDVQPFDGLI